MKCLESLLVLDLTHMLSGPYGAMLLCDLGARTIKVEPPGTGEGTRQLLASSPEYSRQGMGAYFLTLNRNKESVCIDLKSDEGKKVFYELVAIADVVIDNFSVGVTKRLGIDHPVLSRINPGIITCSVTGFGETGPDTQRPAFDQVVQGMGGGMSITGYEGGEPLRSGIPIGDLGGGVFGAIGILAALVARGKTGVGQHVDISMLDVQISLLNYMATMCLMSGINPEPLGNAHFVHVPYNSFKTKTDYIIIACIGDNFYAKLTEVVTRAELKQEKYKTQPGRFPDRELINSIVQEELLTDTAENWLARLRASRIPCAPVNNFAKALNDSQIRARDMVIDVQLKTGEVVSMPGNPVKLSGDSPTDFTAPPLLGEHTDQVLQQLLGYDAARLFELRKEKHIQ
jgi:crotonobetainyl-CoA:carnitine CoA-transferase CaiB-like acyl-CoA transferase